MECDWTSFEKQIYKLIRSRKLGALYAKVDLPIVHPRERTIYTREKLLAPEEIKDFDKLIEKYGKPVTLRLLERRVIKKFF